MAVWGGDSKCSLRLLYPPQRSQTGSGLHVLILQSSLRLR
jgi:hypothetical protein